MKQARYVLEHHVLNASSQNNLFAAALEGLLQCVKQVIPTLMSLFFPDWELK